MLFLFNAQITMALLIYAFNIVIMSFILNTKSGKDIIFKAILGMLIIYMCLNYREILSSIAKFANDDLRSRILELIHFDGVQNTTDGDIGARIRLYTTSLLAFVKNPITGIWGKAGYGSHSTFFDLLGAYGLVGILGIVGLLKPLMILKRVLKKDSNLKKMSIVAILIFITLSCLNVSTSSDILLMVIVFFQESCQCKENVPIMRR